MVGVDVSLDDRANAPAQPTRELDVHAGIERRIDHRGLTVRADQVGEAALPRTAHLHDPRATPRIEYLGGIPGQAPAPHPTLERHGFKASGTQLLDREPARFSGTAHGHDATAV